jgi:hypothetical protein
VITALHQDRTGFIWIGSRDGLALYDGYSFTRFEHDPSDPFSISGNTIRTIYEDGRGDMWFGTNTGGLNRLDRTTWHFEHFRHDSADPRSISHDSVYAILEDRTGALWVGTQHGLNRLDAGTGTFERFLSDPDNPYCSSTRTGRSSRTRRSAARRVVSPGRLTMAICLAPRSKSWRIWTATGWSSWPLGRSGMTTVAHLRTPTAEQFGSCFSTRTGRSNRTKKSATPKAISRAGWTTATASVFLWRL